MHTTTQNDCKITKKPARRQYAQAKIYEMYPKIYGVFPISDYFGQRTIRWVFVRFRGGKCE